MDIIAELTNEMLEAADNLEFERAAYLRDQIKELKKRNAPQTSAPAQSGVVAKRMTSRRK